MIITITGPATPERIELTFRRELTKTWHYFVLIPLPQPWVAERSYDRSTAIWKAHATPSK